MLKWKKYNSSTHPNSNVIQRIREFIKDFNSKIVCLRINHKSLESLGVCVLGHTNGDKAGEFLKGKGL